MRMIHYRVKNVSNLLKMEMTYLHLLLQFVLLKTAWNITPFLCDALSFHSAQMNKDGMKRNTQLVDIIQMGYSLNLFNILEM